MLLASLSFCSNPPLSESPSSPRQPPPSGVERARRHPATRVHLISPEAQIRPGRFLSVPVYCSVKSAIAPQSNHILRPAAGVHFNFS